MVDIQTILPIFTFIGVLVIGAAKYYERKTSGGTEAWSDAKFGMFFIVALLIMGFEYAYSGIPEFPAEETITAVLTILAPIFSLFGFTYTTLMGGKLLKNTVVIPVVSSIKTAVEEKTPVSLPSYGFTVTPTYSFGKSPVTVKFNIYTTQPTAEHAGIVSVNVDWGDGATGLIPLKNGQATVEHQFTFVKNDKYTGHTFYPVFGFNASDGTQTMFNIDGKGVEIWVEA